MRAAAQPAQSRADSTKSPILRVDSGDQEQLEIRIRRERGIDVAEELSLALSQIEWPGRRPGRSLTTSRCDQKFSRSAGAHRWPIVCSIRAC